MELFWKKGFHATSIQDLVDYLGISRGSMYDTFIGKEQLFKEALLLYQRINSVQLKDEEKLLKKESIRAYFEDSFSAQLSYIKQDLEFKGCMVVNSTTELSNQSTDIHSLLNSNKEEVIKWYTHILNIAQERGEISKTKAVEVLAMQLFTFQNGLKVLAKIEKDCQKLQAIVQMELDFIFS